MNVFCVSTMFPTNSEPYFGIFVKRRLLALSKIANVIITAPQPYFPFITLLEKYKVRLNIQHYDKIENDIDVFYPRFLSTPFFLKPLDGIFLFFALYFFIKKKIKQGHKFDVIDAHLAYPDGFAAILLGKIFKLPVTITVRGHDVNVLDTYPIRKRQVLYTLNKADRVFAVSNALRLQAHKLGVQLDKIIPATNGVDTTIFYPKDKLKARKEFGIGESKKVLLSIGFLTENKGYNFVIDAIKIAMDKYGAKDITYLILGGRGGDSYVKDKLEKQVMELGFEDIVRFVPPKPNEELIDWYNCADVFCLASEREGWPNVILESIACGVPVIATNVWGIPEIIGGDAKLGILVERTPESIAAAINTALSKNWDSSYLRRFAESKTWDYTANIIKEEISKIITEKI